MILAGDIGGTHTRLALFEQGRLVVEEKFLSKDYSGLGEIAAFFLKKQGKKVERATFGIAGPVREGKCHATNLPWMLDEMHLRDTLGISKVTLLNDLEANAYGLNVLKPSEFYVLHPGTGHAKGNQALIAAGTGLGEAGLFWDGKAHHPFACEGGHADFAPTNDLEIELLQTLRKKHHHVSYERVVSGPGLYEIYRFLIESGKEDENRKITEEMRTEDPSKVISEWGEKDRGALLALNLFVTLYGREAGNLALKFLATGGLFIGGGIAPRLLPRLKEGSFVASFADKGRFQELLLSIPIRVILNDNAALLGAAYHAEKR